MQTKRLTRIFFIVFSVGLLILAKGHAQAKTPTNVSLLYFTATPQENGIRLDWETATELGTAGFKIERSPGTSDDYEELDNIGFVPARGGVATGAVYSAVDDSAVYGQTYTYKLVEVETSSNTIDLETVTIAFIIVPTATPIVVDPGDGSGDAPTQTPPPTSSPTPSATPTNTAVPANATATPSNQQATATPTSPPTATNSSAANASPTLRPTTAPDAPSGDESTDTGVVLAQEQEPTAYPGPTTVTPFPTDESYPAGQPPTAVPMDVDPILSDTDPIPPTVAIIGGQAEEYPQPEAAEPTTAPEEIIRGRIFLWAGFLIALFIFGAGVIGAIILYRRKRE
ncbi:MAG: hypothetical protein GY803_19875 [Chloroflexi bacterium]|nr:hypothetical protein [Chloroflexota bacterium]